MTKQEEIAQFLDQHITLPRVAQPFGWGGQQWWAQPYPYLQQRPTYQQVAHELLASSEFRALQLGSWLGTTDGQIITEAVELVAPPFYREDIELLVDALKFAAQLQSQEGQGKAGIIALGALGIAAAVAIGISTGGGRAA
ncbi:MAG: hypothetical protein ABSD85_16075 [Acidimicrobiales bacterium]|jgi:hypothetical protein